MGKRRELPRLDPGVRLRGAVIQLGLNRLDYAVIMQAVIDNDYNGVECHVNKTLLQLYLDQTIRTGFC